MAKKKFATVEEIDTVINFESSIPYHRYLNDDPSPVKQRVRNFIRKMRTAAVGKIESSLLTDLLREMASEHSTPGIALNYIIEQAMEPEGDTEPVDDAIILTFEFPIDLKEGVNLEEVDIKCLTAIWLYFWKSYFPPDEGFMGRSKTIEKHYAGAKQFYKDRMGPDTGLIAKPVIELVQGTGDTSPEYQPNQKLDEDASKPASMGNLEDLERRTSKYLTELNETTIQRFRALGNVYVSIQRQEVMMQAVKETKDAKAGLKEQKEATAKVITDNSEKLADIMKRAEEFAKYKALDNYFETKSRNHYIQFGVWLALFIGSLIGICVCFVVFYDKIEPLLPHITANNFNLGSSVLIIATTLMVAWILRVFIRLAMLNLQLAEDASNRTVLIRTLAALESESGDLPKEQKIIAYNAIFRASLSDNSNLDVAQPTLGDLSGLFKGK